MNESQEAHESWVRSAPGWIRSIERGDINRTHLLDEPMLRLVQAEPGTRFLDVGCGEGRFCRMLSERGATTVGIDPTPPLIERAQSLHPQGEYVLGRAEALPFPDDSFDLVASYLTLIDIADYQAAIREMARVLRPGGRLIIANLQSFASTRPRAWYQNEKGEKLHLAVEDYFEERSVRVEWGSISILNWHRPLEAYMKTFLEARLRLAAFEEPRPTPEAVAQHPSMLDEYRVPLFYVMAWERTG